MVWHFVQFSTPSSEACPRERSPGDICENATTGASSRNETTNEERSTARDRFVLCRNTGAHTGSGAVDVMDESIEGTRRGSLDGLSPQAFRFARFDPEKKNEARAPGLSRSVGRDRAEVPE